MVKVIVAKEKFDCSKLEGTFVDESHYDHLIEEDTDVYMPSSIDGGDPYSEKRIVLKFRKNYFTQEQQDQAAHEGLEFGCCARQNNPYQQGES